MGVKSFRTLECPICRIHPAVTAAGQPVTQIPGAPVRLNGDSIHAARAKVSIGHRPALHLHSGFDIGAQIQKTICLSLRHRSGYSNRAYSRENNASQGVSSHDRAAPLQDGHG
jgi:hypothetical protein